MTAFLLARPPFPPGTRVRVAQKVRVGDQNWTTYVTGTVEGDGLRPVGGMEMGSKSRFGVQPTLRLRLDDGEITVVAIDDHTRIDAIPRANASGGR
jgi:hypothetical protein